jgi:hypothetical protein
VLEFDDNDVDCERDDEIVVFVRVGDVFGKSDCGVVVVEGDEVEIVLGEKIGVFGGDGDKGDNCCGKQFLSKQTKISTTSEGPLELYPPPKNILFDDDVDASE